MEALHWYRAGQGRHRRRPSTPLDPGADRQPPAQTRLDGRYRLIELVARGGWSTVWRGCDERLSRPVAIKILDASQARWVHSEASSLAKLTHAHIATVYDYGRTATGYYIVLEFVEGGSLADALELGPLPWSVAVRHCAEVASALAAAHRRGLVHRDVTPGNIMLTSSGVKLIDFGLTVVEGVAENDFDGVARGTPPYVAPERLTGTSVTAASDVFGLAAVLYRAITGEPPWVADTIPELLALQATTDPAPLPPIAGLPDAVARACLRGLSRNPDDRPTAAEMASLLDDAAAVVRSVETVPSEPATDHAVVTHSLRRTPPTSAPVARGSTRVLRWVTAVFVLVLLGGLGWLLTGWGPGDSSVTSALVNPPESGPPEPACVVAYQLTSGPGEPFAATVTVTNTGQPMAPGWRLSYHPPPGAGQPLTPRGQAQTVASEPLGPLGHGGSIQMSLTAPAPAADPGPRSFLVNGQPCVAVPFPSTGTPSLPAPAVPAVAAGPLVRAGGPNAPGAGEPDAPAAAGPRATKVAHGSADTRGRSGRAKA